MHMNMLSEPVSERFRPLPDGGIRIFAPAKINLNLLVGPVRRDNFHPIDSIVCRVSLYDQVDLMPSKSGETTLTCEGFECGDVRDNLAMRAFELMAKTFDVGDGADICLKKNIPPGKGLGGGSSDAAAVIWGLNRLWQLDVPRDRLMSLGAVLGSDVPLFLGPCCARMTGRGEALEEASVRRFYAVLFLDESHCPTGPVYRAFDSSPQPMCEQLAQRLLSGPPAEWRGRLVNQLADAARSVCPEMASIWDRLSMMLEEPVRMTGSGSALFVLVDDEAQAVGVFNRIPEDIRGRCVIVSKNPW